MTRRPGRLRYGPRPAHVGPSVEETEAILAATPSIRCPRLLPNGAAWERRARPWGHDGVCEVEMARAEGLGEGA